MKSIYKYIFFVSFVIFVLCSPPPAGSQVMDDYTAYPPFVTSAVPPNILLVLDHSGSMQFPAYIGCDWSNYDNKRAECGESDSIQDPEFQYIATKDYYGYFEIDEYYEYGTNKFLENDTCVFAASDPGYRIGDTSGCISGNLLNWATMSRIDLLRKVLVGGKAVSSQTNNHTLRAEGGWRKFSDTNLGCTFELSGGSYPQLDHTLSISDYDCGLLKVATDGSYIFGTNDSFRFINQPASGDFDIKLRVVSPPAETGQTYAKAGLMVRASTGSGSQHVKAMATFGAGLQFSERATDGGDTTLVGSYVPISYPVWVRIIRSGDVFTYYYSSDGSTWNNHGSSTVIMPADVLVGMATASYASGIYGTASYDEFICDVCTSDDFNDASFDAVTWTALDISTSLAGSETEGCSSCAVGTLSSADTMVDVPDRERRGIIQNLADTDYDADWDENAPRFGLMIYANDSRQGEMKTGIAGSNMSSFLTALQNEPPYSGTPTGEALREAHDYFAQDNSFPYESNNAYIGNAGSVKDPFYEDGEVTACRKNFILLISDGQWNGDVDPVIPARVNHITDIRPDIEGDQNIATYAVFTFNEDQNGINSMQQTALFGGFKDKDNDTWPYDRNGYPADSRNATLPLAPCDPASLPMDENCKEWDRKGASDQPDGLPDNYYSASDGSKLEGQILQAITDMLQQSSSGTAVSVLATTGEGDGAVYQAYFYPEKNEFSDTRKWLGYVHSLFVDQYGNIREDTDGDDALDLEKDLILVMEYDPDDGTMIKRYNDTYGDGVPDSLVSKVGIDEVESLWRGGDILWETAPDERNIYSTIDGINISDFTTANVTEFKPYLRAADDDETTNIIDWIRGYDFKDGGAAAEFKPAATGIDAGHPAGYRQRGITDEDSSGATNTHVWKLGDIIYSTPTVVGQPMENYDMLYNDVTYNMFLNKYRKRRHIVYIGANDGMLHAFNGGFFDSSAHRYCTDPDCSNSGIPLGEELWGFIPRGLLPHLKWLTDPDYTHVYYVDLKPKVTDVAIFSDKSDTGKWGTILIGGFRYGGDDISCPAPCNSTAPEYFALDITDYDPNDKSPKLLWTFTDPDLGLSMSYPSVAKVGDKWYAIFGSGATEFDEGSNLTGFQDGYVFVLDISSGTDGKIDTWTEGDNYWKFWTGESTAYMADSITVDVDKDYHVDVMYIGENYQSGNSWNARMHRLTTNNGTAPSPLSGQWQLSTLADVNAVAGNKDDAKKITAAPSTALDERAYFWVYFGTGQFMGLNDKNVTDSGAFYGIKDECWDGCATSYTSADIIDVSNAVVKTNGTVENVTGCGGSPNSWSDLLSNSRNCNGWALYFNQTTKAVDFLGENLIHGGERVFSKPLVLGGLVAYGSYIPGNDVCSFLGESNAYALYYTTGTAYRTFVFDKQKEMYEDNPTAVVEVERTIHLGKGMPSSPSGHRTQETYSKNQTDPPGPKKPPKKSKGKVKIYFQQSTGNIVSAENETPIAITSGLKGWRNERIP